MIRLFTEIAAAYIVTLILVSGSIFFNFRVWLRERTPFLFKGMPPKHFIDCRLCVGFWVSLLISVACGDWKLFPLIYGASYFMATQER